MEYTTVTNLKYVVADNSVIECYVDFVGIGNVPFAAWPNDTEAHGREIYQKAVNGDFGAITAFTPHVPTADEIRQAFIIERAAEVAALTVTVNGKVFNGDEVSQSRMARAIISAGVINATSTNWTLANNVSTEVTLVELQTALAMSMQAMAAIWVQE